MRSVPKTTSRTLGSRFGVRLEWAPEPDLESFEGFEGLVGVSEVMEGAIELVR